MATHQAEAAFTAAATLAAAAWTHIDVQAQAREYRRQQQAREDNRLARELALAGDPSAVRRNEVAWDPLRRWQGWDPIRRVKGDPE